MPAESRPRETVCHCQSVAGTAPPAADLAQFVPEVDKLKEEPPRASSALPASVLLGLAPD